MRSIVSVMFVGEVFFSNALDHSLGNELSDTQATRLGDKKQKPRPLPILPTLDIRLLFITEPCSKRKR